MKRKFFVLLTLLLTLILPGSVLAARQITPEDITVPDGYKIEASVTDLGAPTMVAFDDQGRMLIAESGYGQTGAKVTRIEKNGERTELLNGDSLGSELPITAVSFHEGSVYVVHGGSITTILDDSEPQTILTGIPHGDHQANQLVFKDGFAYLAVGTVTNSGVVGPDNAVFGWLKNPNNATKHDVPCSDYELTDKTFESENVIGDSDEKVQTSPYAAFGAIVTSAKGDTKCGGSILRFRPDGSALEIFASGLRNPYGLEIGPDGQLYATMHGFDARGSRPIENAWDCLYKIEQGTWYGFPDFACDVPVTDARFRVQDKPAPEFIVKNHPSSTPPKPIAKFNPHVAINGFAFAPNDKWGKPTDTFVALFGDFTPATGTVSEPQGVKIVRVNTANGETSDFITNKVAGQASRHNAGGLEHPSDVTFGPDGAMYIADWGIARVSTDGLQLEENSGVVWKVTKLTSASSDSAATSPSLLLKIPLIIILSFATYFIGRGAVRKNRVTARFTVLQGVVGGLITAVATIIISTLALQLPWHTPPRVLATIPIGESAIANVLEFKLTPVLVGSLVLLALSTALAFLFNLVVRTTNPIKLLISSVLFGLTVWAVLQYFIFPYLFPLITEKGFPPNWYAVTFSVLGLALGLIKLMRHQDSN